MSIPSGATCARRLSPFSSAILVAGGVEGAGRFLDLPGAAPQVGGAVCALLPPAAAPVVLIRPARARRGAAAAGTR